MKTTRPLALAVGLALLGAPAILAQSASETLYEAFYLEEGVRQMEEAAAKYAAAAQLAATAGDAATEAKARLGHARCMLALGVLDVAYAEYEAVLRLDPENAAARVALERRSQQDGLDPELRMKVQGLVRKLGGAEREQASADLRRIGDLAVPFLADGLRSRDVAVVENASLLLAGNGTPGALDRLDAAFGDPEVLFPHLLVSALHARVPDVDHPVWLRVIERPVSDERHLALKRFNDQAVARLSCVPRLRRLLSDEDVRVRLDLLQRLEEPTISELLDDVIARIASPDAEERRAIADCLDEVERSVPEATAALVALLGDDEYEIRRQAQYGIRAHAKKGRASVELVHEAAARLLADEDLRLVEEGTKLLKDFSGPWSDEVRSRAMAAIGRLAVASETGREFVWLLDGRPELTDADLTALFHRGTDPSWLLTDNYRGRYRLENARRVVMRQPDDAARVRWISETFAETADPVGQRILIDLGNGMPTEPHAEVMLLGAASKHPEVREEAYEQLQPRKRTRNMLPAFVYDRLPYFDEDLVSDVAGLSGELFSLVAGHPRPAWEASAAAFHARHGNPQTFDFLVGCAGDGAAERAREELRGSNEQVWPRAVDVLIEQLGAEAAGREVAALAVERASPLELMSGRGRVTGLVKDVPTEFLAAFVAALPDEDVDAGVIRHTFETLPAAQLDRMIELGVRSADPEMQAAACQAVSFTVHEPALGRVTPLLDSPHLNVRSQAEAAVDAIRRRIERRTQADLLGPEGKSASITRARALLDSDDPLKRQGGALALGALGDASVVPLLLDLLEDEDPAVRAAALKALESLGAGRSGG